APVVAPAPAPVVAPVPVGAGVPPAPTPRLSLNSGDDAPVRESYLKGRVGAATGRVFQVRLVGDGGLDRTISVEEGEFVLDAADRAGIELPSSCRNGGCLTCTGRLVGEGDTTMEEQYTLEPEHQAVGFRLLCVTTVRGDCTFRTHQQDEVE
ncbi:MAG: 2Fe-2S iron-sulfur cluster-binding protein, partial [Myxococcota bacterium]